MEYKKILTSMVIVWFGFKTYSDNEEYYRDGSMPKQVLRDFGNKCRTFEELRLEISTMKSVCTNFDETYSGSKTKLIQSQK